LGNWMEEKMMENEKVSTKGKILNSAVTLFAEKGFTETTIRELAGDIGLNSAFSDGMMGIRGTEKKSC